MTPFRKIEPLHVIVVGFGTDVVLQRRGRRGCFGFAGDGLCELFRQQVSLTEISVVAISPHVGISWPVNKLQI